MEHIKKIKQEASEGEICCIVSNSDEIDRLLIELYKNTIHLTVPQAIKQ